MEEIEKVVQFLPGFSEVRVSMRHIILCFRYVQQSIDTVVSEFRRFDIELRDSYLDSEMSDTTKTKTQRKPSGNTDDTCIFPQLLFMYMFDEVVLKRGVPTNRIPATHAKQTTMCSYRRRRGKPQLAGCSLLRDQRHSRQRVPHWRWSARQA